jgi:uncharacterized membrane protein YbhN (UPF0104 family)
LDRPEAGDDPLRADLRAAARRLLRRGVLLVVGAAVALAAWVLLGGRTQPLTDAALRALRADWRWVAAGVAGEALSFAGYIVLFARIVAPAAPRVGLRASAEITFAGAATTRLLPTAGVGGLALTAWALRRAGLGTRATAERLIAFLLVLYLVYTGALVLAGTALATGLAPGGGPPTLTVGGALVGALVVAGVLLAAHRTASPPDAQRRGWGGRLAAIRPALAGGLRIATGVARSGDPRLLGAVAWWAFDLAVLWSMFQAFGAPPPLAVAVVAYFLGTLANTIPLPGAVSTTTVAVHVAFGLPLATVLPAVLAYRAVALWLPAVGGTLALGGLRATVRAWAHEPEQA